MQLYIPIENNKSIHHLSNDKHVSEIIKRRDFGWKKLTKYFTIKIEITNFHNY